MKIAFDSESKTLEGTVCGAFGRCGLCGRNNMAVLEVEITFPVHYFAMAEDDRISFCFICINEIHGKLRDDMEE